MPNYLKKKVFYSFFIISISLFSQNQKSGIVLDIENLEPIEFVTIYNNYDNTITNENGKFFFFSAGDSITFSKLGYKKFKADFNTLPDTILLAKKLIELEGVTLVQTDSLWGKLKKNISKNYTLLPYNEKFFLRGSLKLNDTLVRIQDIQGKLKRKTLLYANDIELTNKDYEIEMTNMRKIGIVTSKNDVYFKFPTFFGLLSSFARINATAPGFKLTEIPFPNEEKTRYEFDYTGESGSIRGHYIINTSNYAIEEFYLLQKAKNIPYQKNKWLLYKTNIHEVKIFFDYDLTAHKYVIRNASFRQEVETTNKENSFKDVYESTFILSTYDNFGEFKVDKNTNATKDIFKIKYKYNPNYWKEQNQLLLTDEMLDFIKSTKVKNKEFKIRSNIK